MSAFDQDFGAKVRSWRLHNHITQEQLGRSADRDAGAQTWINKIESGKQRATLEQAVNIAAVLGIPLSRLLTEPPTRVEVSALQLPPHPDPRCLG